MLSKLMLLLKLKVNYILSAAMYISTNKFIAYLVFEGLLKVLSAEAHDLWGSIEWTDAYAKSENDPFPLHNTKTYFNELF